MSQPVFFFDDAGYHLIGVDLHFTPEQWHALIAALPPGDPHANMGPAVASHIQHMAETWGKLLKACEFAAKTLEGYQIRNEDGSIYSGFCLRALETLNEAIEDAKGANHAQT